MMFWSDSHLVFWQAGLMWIGMIAFWGLLLWGIVTLTRGPDRRPDGEYRLDDARQILDRRLASGEIDTDEYRRLRDVIAGDRTPVASGGRE